MKKFLSKLLFRDAPGKLADDLPRPVDPVSVGQNILSADNKNLAPNESGVIFLLLEKPEDTAKLSEMIKCTFMKKKKNQNL